LIEPPVVEGPIVQRFPEPLAVASDIASGNVDNLQDLQTSLPLTRPVTPGHFAQPMRTQRPLVDLLRAYLSCCGPFEFPLARDPENSIAQNIVFKGAICIAGQPQQG
jgi:hypothetical protein